MKLKRLTLTFEHPLDKIVFYQDQYVEQERILEADVEGIRENIRKRLRKMLTSMNMIRFLNPALIEVMQFKLAGMDATFKWMVEFKKVSPTVYTFTYPMDATAMLTLKKWGLNIGPFKLKERDIHLAQLLKEQTLIDAFKKFSFKSMGLEEGEYSISSEELETEPETPPPSPSLPPEGSIPTQKSEELSHQDVAQP